jgi:NAD(P)-dependent dehydrogenase (short-subunit alcohol dehydrogenase family)
VVNLSSTAHKISGVDFNYPHFEHRAHDQWQAYGQAKTANVLFTVALDGTNAMGWLDEHGRPRERFKTVQGGAATATWATTPKLLERHGGEYLEDCNVAKIAVEGERFSGVNAHAQEPATAKRLWEFSERLLGERFSFA